jgi:hypothetical protein
MLTTGTILSACLTQVTFKDSLQSIPSAILQISSVCMWMRGAGCSRKVRGAVPAVPNKTMHSKSDTVAGHRSTVIVHKADIIPKAPNIFRVGRYTVVRYWASRPHRQLPEKM